MAPAPPEINLAWCGWCDDAERLLAPAAARDATHGLKGWAADALRGDLEIFGVYESGAMVAAVALRVAIYPRGRELVIVGAGGRLPGVSLIDTVYPAIEKAARAARCGSVVYHTTRDGLPRVMDRHGFKLDAVLYRKELT